MIRFLLIALLLILFLVFSIPLLVFEAVLGRYAPDSQKRQSVAVVRFMFRLLLKISGTKVTVEGRENIPEDQAVLYVGNHRSYFDILIGYSTTPGLLGFVAKKEMLRYPLLKNWMEHVQCLFLDRDDIKEGLKTILTGIEKVKSGISIWIFPEGTRNENEEFTDLLPFKEGSLKIAEKAGCPVIPVAMVGNADIFENHIPFIRPKRVRIRYGQPIYLKELPKEVKKKSGSYVRDVIIGMLNEMVSEEGTENEESGFTGNQGPVGSN
ncbi:MAG: 1-acyl-sn-glycerol-3-phosphate acyltransferase [Lachnospiraceae bacterium]|nr:1-acyl-sn-glycerol-3-phosphate acyltransferase [Lachnospiraceae bacterium]